MMKSPSDREHHAPSLVVLAILALSGLTGCQQDSGGSHCVVGLEETLQNSGVLPLDRDPYGLEERIYEDQAFSPAKGIVIDPQPLSRGLHPVMRFWQDPTTCEAVGGTYP